MVKVYEILSSIIQFANKSVRMDVKFVYYSVLN